MLEDSTDDVFFDANSIWNQERTSLALDQHASDEFQQALRVIGAADIEAAKNFQLKAKVEVYHKELKLCHERIERLQAACDKHPEHIKNMFRDYFNETDKDQGPSPEKPMNTTSFEIPTEERGRTLEKQTKIMTSPTGAPQAAPEEDVQLQRNPSTSPRFASLNPFRSKKLDRRDSNGFHSSNPYHEGGVKSNHLPRLLQKSSSSIEWLMGHSRKDSQASNKSGRCSGSPSGDRIREGFANIKDAVKDTASNLPMFSFPKKENSLRVFDDEDMISFNSPCPSPRRLRLVRAESPLGTKTWAVRGKKNNGSAAGEPSSLPFILGPFNTAKEPFLGRENISQYTTLPSTATLLEQEFTDTTDAYLFSPMTPLRKPSTSLASPLYPPRSSSLKSPLSNVVNADNSIMDDSSQALTAKDDPGIIDYSCFAIIPKDGPTRTIIIPKAEPGLVESSFQAFIFSTDSSMMADSSQEIMIEAKPSYMDDAYKTPIPHADSSYTDDTSQIPNQWVSDISSMDGSDARDDQSGSKEGSSIQQGFLPIGNSSIVQGFVRIASNGQVVSRNTSRNSSLAPATVPTVPAKDEPRIFAARKAGKSVYVRRKSYRGHSTKPSFGSRATAIARSMAETVRRKKRNSTNAGGNEGGMRTKSSLAQRVVGTIKRKTSEMDR